LRPERITPNGAVAFALIVIGATMATLSFRGLLALAILSFAFAVIEVGRPTVTALRRSIMLVLPLAVFMAIVWIGIVGRSPAEIAAGTVGTRTAALLHVARICARLFIVVFTIQSLIVCFASSTPLRFIRALYAPLTLKRLLVLTLSLIETFRHAIDRAHTALVSAGLLTRKMSVHNLLNAWVLVQTVWLTAITIVMRRLRDKWPIERTLSLLDGALMRVEPRTLSRDDLLWLPLVLGATIFAIRAS
jgi:hypothetical protein